jgi:hypothetical protein
LVTATSGPLAVTNPFGSATTPSGFTLVPGTITSLSPTNAIVGETITVAGDFDLGAYRTVTFAGAVSATASPDGLGNITVHVPAGAQSGPINLPSPDGHLPELTSSQSLTVLPPPSVTSITPSSGPVSGGTTVTISGTGFTTATQVSLGGQPIPFTIVDAQTITFVTPPHEAAGTGSFDVTVTNPNGTSTTTPSDVFTYF